MRRPCLECGRPIAIGSRCAGCDNRPPYDGAWARMAKAQIAADPRCRDCGHTGSIDNPLTADHVVPRARGGRNEPSNLATRCRVCNSAKGDR
jgi:5-methylcytosine-specific restriction endonuclease McrA